MTANDQGQGMLSVDLWGKCNSKCSKPERTTRKRRKTWRRRLGWSPVYVVRGVRFDQVRYHRLPTQLLVVDVAMIMLPLFQAPSAAP